MGSIITSEVQKPEPKTYTEYFSGLIFGKKKSVLPIVTSSAEPYESLVQVKAEKRSFR